MEMNLKLLVSPVILVTFPYFICSGGFQWTFIYTHEQKFITLKSWESVKASVRSVLLYISETWLMSTGDLSHIKTNDHAMIW